MKRYYRACFVPALEKSVVEMFTHEASSLAEAKNIKNALARYALYLNSKKLMPAYSNIAFIEEFVDGEWEEVEADES